MLNEKKEGISATLIRYFIPVALGFLLQQTYSMVDAIVIGRLVGKSALAAIGGSNSTLISFVLGFFGGLSSGPMIVSAHYHGAGDENGVDKTIRNALVFSLALGLVLTFLFNCCAYPIHRLLGTPDDVIDLSCTYLRWYFIGIVPTLAFNMCTNLLRSFGEVNKPLLCLLASTVLNLVLDVVFVAVLKFGVKGVAIASALSQFLGCVLVLLYLNKVRNGRIFIAEGLSMENVRKFLGIGLPSGLQNSMYFITSLIISYAVNSLGTNSVASWAIFYKMDALFWAISSSFNLSIAALSGQLYGARDEKGIHRCLGISLLWYLVFTLPICLAMFFGRSALPRLFTSESSVIAETAVITGYVALCYPLFAPTEVISALIRGCGNASRPAFLTFICVFVLRLVLLFSVTLRHTTNLTISFNYSIIWAISSVVFICYYLFGKWMPPFETRKENEK